jgi:uncharacterized damage-inducible protein DinB
VYLPLRLRGYHSRVLNLQTSLAHHQSWADATLLTAVQSHPNSLHDEHMFKTLHHIVMVQRLYPARILNRPFDKEKESQRRESFDQLVQLYRATHEELLAFVTNLTESDLERRFELPVLKSQPTIAEGLTQIVMHSQNHRRPTRLRENGAMPTPQTRFWPTSSMPKTTPRPRGRNRQFQSLVSSPSPSNGSSQLTRGSSSCQST